MELRGQIRLNLATLRSMTLTCTMSKKCRTGFSLIELMIALFVFAIVMAGGYACVKMGLELVDKSRHHTRVSQIMQSEIERVRSMAWSELTALPSAATQLTISNEFNQTGYGTYRLTRTVAGSGSFRKITLLITWTDLGGRSRSKTYATQYTQGGIYDYIQ
jgi:prepilin-type N-terminal cleavage/methylation domain-containing protein